MKDILALMVTIPGTFIMHLLPFLVVCFLVTIPLYPVALVMDIAKKK
jgi:hypothetical protein